MHIQEQIETFHKHPEEVGQVEVSEEDVEDAVDGGEGGQGVLPVMEHDHEVLESEE